MPGGLGAPKRAGKACAGVKKFPERRAPGCARRMALAARRRSIFCGPGRGSRPTGRTTGFPVDAATPPGRHSASPPYNVVL